MGDVLEFRRQEDRPVIDVSAYQAEIYGEESLLRVREVISATFSISDFTPAPVNVAIIDGYAPMGMVTNRTNAVQAREAEVVTDTNFPLTVHESLFDIPAVDALQIAADYVNAFGLIVRGLRAMYQPLTHTFSKDLMEKVWHSKVPVQEVVAHRAAARVALRAHGQQPPIITNPPTLPPHIASLINPLDGMQLRSLHAVLKKAGSVSN